jgi:3-hydroxyacyl-CoA dehydrogenase
MTSTVRMECDGDVAVIVIDNPPVNATSADVRRGLVDAIQSASRDDAVTAVVIIGAGKTFAGGADIREFDKPLAEPSLPAVIAAIGSPIPPGASRPPPTDCGLVSRATLP